MVDEPFDVRMKSATERILRTVEMKRLDTSDTKTGSWSADVLKKVLFHAMSLSVRWDRLVA